MILEVYKPEIKDQWDRFIRDSYNGTFLFFRNYMNYHADRFIDNSLIIKDENEIVALFPCNKKNNSLISHGGLTYGGVIFGNLIHCSKMLRCFDLIHDYCRSNEINKIVYKAIPHIYHLKPSEEDLYSLFRNNYNIIRREPSASINMFRNTIAGKKVNGYKRALKNGLSIKEVVSSNNILNLVNQTLQAKYGVAAVHSSSEMDFLYKNFPKNIRLFEVLYEDEVVGGAILYLDKIVVHAQYLTTNNIGKQLRAMDLMICYFYEQYKDSFEWFDFGISSENGGQELNENLMRQKEEFGATVICYDTYEKVIG